MKPFREVTLNLFSLFSYVILSKKEISNAINEYKMELKDGKTKFSQNIAKYGFVIASTDNIRLSDLYSTAVTFRSNKKLVKKIFGQIMFLPLWFGILVIPFIIPKCLYPLTEFKWSDFLINYMICYLAVILLALFLIPLFDTISNFEIRIGKALNNLILFTVLALFCSSGYCFYNNLESIPLGIFCGYILVYLIISVLIIEYLTELIIDAYYFSYKVQITDALILESSYRLTFTKWHEAVKKKKLRQTTLSEIERLASLIEKDWSNHTIPGDEKISKWKANTLIGIAMSIRKTKRQVIIPSLNAPIELKTSFESIFEKILKHDIQGLIDEEVPVSRIKKKSRLELLQSFIVAIVPLLISIGMRYLPSGTIEPNYIHLSIIISSIWFLLSALLWLDPNL